MEITIRLATRNDFSAMWEIFHAVTQGGDTYVFAPDTPREEVFEYWFGPGVTSFVAEDRGWTLGMYRLKANQRDLGSHIANASFMVSPGQQGLGIGTMMGKHSLIEAKKAGFLAMQFNFVVATNEAAVSLWKKLGFAIIGTIPKGFRHAKLGLVDSYVMFRFLDDVDA